MLSIAVVCLMAAIVTSAQDAPEMPEAWKQKVEAAEKAIESGHPIKAEALLAEIVEEAEKLSKDDLRLAEPLEKLAGFYLDNKRKRYMEADPLYRRALAIREKAQGADHPDVARTLLHLAMCRLVADQKQGDAAGPMLRRALAIIEKAKGKDAPELAHALSGIAMWHMMRKEFDAAEAALTRALAIREKVLGSGDPQVADLLENLGVIHTLQVDGIDTEPIPAEIGNKPKTESKFERHRKLAESFFTRALAIREKALKPDHRKIAESLYNLGVLASIRGRHADAERYLERWMVLEEKAKEPASERQAKGLMGLAEASMAQKHFDQAERQLAKAQAAIETVKGADSNEASIFLLTRADNAQRAGRFDAAERFLKKGLEVQTALIGPDDADVKEACVLMAGRYLDHLDDRKAPVLWHRMEALKMACWEHQHYGLGNILEGYARLMRRTNRVLPRPTEEDLTYLKKVDVVLPSLSTDLDSLATIDGLFTKNLDDEGLSHIARVYDIERLNLNRLPNNERSITDAGLAHIKGLINLKVLSLIGIPITDAGLAHIKGLENLEELDLGSTRVDDAGLTHLQGLKALRDLGLNSTNVTDAGLDHLKGLGHLQRLGLRSTKVTATGINRLRQVRPDLEIESEPLPATVPDDRGARPLRVPAGLAPEAGLRAPQ